MSLDNPYDDLDSLMSSSSLHAEEIQQEHANITPKAENGSSRPDVIDGASVQTEGITEAAYHHDGQRTFDRTHEEHLYPHSPSAENGISGSKDELRPESDTHVEHSTRSPSSNRSLRVTPTPAEDTLLFSPSSTRSRASEFSADVRLALFWCNILKP